MGGGSLAPGLEALLPGKRDGTHCTTVGWMGHRACMNGWETTRPHLGSNTAPSNPYRVTIPTVLIRRTISWLQTSEQ